MKIAFSLILIVLATGRFSVAAVTPTMIVDQKLGATPVAIYAFNKIEVVSEDASPEGFKLLRAFVDVTAESNICGAKAVAAQIQLIDANLPMGGYEIGLQAIGDLSIEDRISGCAFNSKPVAMKIPLIVNGGTGAFPFAEKYSLKVSDGFTGVEKTVTIQISRTGNVWSIHTN